MSEDNAVAARGDDGARPVLPTHEDEPHSEAHENRLNRLRAGVLGANDGIVSVAGIVIGVAGATAADAPLLSAGVAGLVAGAVSMALGEYVSVSSQRDAERSLLAKERRELEDEPDEELDELAAIYEAKGLRSSTATQVARELTAHDALAAHVDAELKIDPDDLNSPTQAAVTSAVAFTLGGLLPLLAILLPSSAWRVPVCFVAVLFALGVAGWTSARLGGGSPVTATLRLVVGGGLGLLVTYGIGSLVGTAIS